MRIRKRFPPSSSYLSSLPLSDPQLNRSPVVQQHLLRGAHPDGNRNNNGSSQSSDHPNQPPRPPPSNQNPAIGSGRARARWVFSDRTTAQELKHKELEGEEVKEDRWGEEEKSTNETRAGSILGAEVGTSNATGLLPPTAPGSSPQEVGRWCEGDKTVPLKKRRGSFDRKFDEDHAIMEEEEDDEKEVKMKSKTNKKCVQLNGDGHVGGRKETKETKEGSDNGTTIGVMKKLKRGNVIMEGSRCSRVNGRGWRCCQQTLVGYSLCEHHLGKGRLRSMTSVRNRAMATNTIIAPKKVGESGQLSNSSLSLVQEKQFGQIFVDEEDDDDDDDEEDFDDEKKPLMGTKRRMKLGMVKARSISSLLGQRDINAVVAVGVADDNNKNSGV